MNSADDSMEPNQNINAMVYSTGLINYVPPGVFKSTCLIDIKSFPFNEQKCSLRFQR